MIIVKSSEPKVMNIYIYIYSFFWCDRVVIVRGNINAVLRDKSSSVGCKYFVFQQQPEKSHRFLCCLFAQMGENSWQKCIFYHPLIDLLILNNIYIHSIYRPLSFLCSWGPPYSPLPSLHPSLQPNKMKVFIAEEGWRARLSAAVSLISRKSLQY